MTVSKDKRSEDARTALLVLLEALGDRPLLEGVVAEDDPAVCHLLPTTWSALERKGYIRNAGLMGPRPRYELTSIGWLTALELSGQIHSPDFLHRVTKLLKALKRTVKSRDNVTLVDVRDLAAETSIPLGWLFNAFDAHLLEVVYPGRGYALRYDPPVVWVSPDFGHEALEI